MSRVAALVSVAAASLLVVGFVVGLRWYDREHRFDVAKWRTNMPGDCNDSYRQRMVGDLSKHYLRVGLTPSAVTWLLGSPERVETSENGEKLWDYDLGSVGSDCVRFWVWFGTDGRHVTRWKRIN